MKDVEEYEELELTFDEFYKDVATFSATNSVGEVVEACLLPQYRDGFEASHTVGELADMGAGISVNAMTIREMDDPW